MKCSHFFGMAALALSLNFSLSGQTGIPIPQMSNCDLLVQNFLTKYNIPGATLAIAKDGRLVYSRAFGFVNEQKNLPVLPGNLFRIASLSKPVTAIAIMKLVEEGKLSLDSKVFGPQGILGKDAYLSKSAITDARIYDITVQQLLEHTGGWNRDQACLPNPALPYPWAFGHCDPIAFPLYVTRALGESNPVTERMLIRFLLQKGLDFAPGTQYVYSNMGYLALGLVIEQITGSDYETYVKTAILEPLGIFDLHLGRNLLKDKLEREVEYAGAFTTLSLYGDGATVPWQYGGWSLEAMDAHGGWIATARDLVRLLVAVDGFSTKADILKPATIATMVTPSTRNNGYAKGWAVNTANNWWHTGSLDGTASVMVRTSNGFTWAFLLNKRVEGNNQFWADLDNLPWNCIGPVGSFPFHDFLAAPARPAKDLELDKNEGTSVRLKWTSGNGTNRILLIREANAVDQFPLDGSSYAADPAFGKGAKLGADVYAVYNGTGKEATVTGLKPNTRYHVRLFEYTQNMDTGSLPLYLLGKSPVLSFTTGMVSSTYFLGETRIDIFPNPVRDDLMIDFKGQGHLQVDIYSASGQQLSRQKLHFDSSAKTIDLRGLPRGMLLLRISDPKQPGLAVTHNLVRIE